MLPDADQELLIESGHRSSALDHLHLQADQAPAERSGPWMFAGAVVIAAAIFLKDRPAAVAPPAAGFQSMA